MKKFPLIFIFILFWGPLFNLFYLHPKVIDLMQIIQDDISRDIFYLIRIPRELICFLAGGSLALAGLTIQEITQNPLTSPNVLGLNSIITFSMILYVNYLGDLPLEGSYFFSTVAAFLGMLILLLISKLLRIQLMGLEFLLIGIFNGLFFNSLNYLLLILDEKNTYEIITWTFGQVDGKNYTEVLWILLSSALGICVLKLIKPKLIILRTGDDKAQSLGINLNWTRFWAFFSIIILVSFVCSICGPIGFLGLIIPYIVKQLFPTQDFPIALTFLVGGLGLSWLDFFSRWINFPYEFPVGLILGVIGSLFFILIALNKKLI